MRVAVLREDDWRRAVAAATAEVAARAEAERRRPLPPGATVATRTGGTIVLTIDPYSPITASASGPNGLSAEGMIDGSIRVEAASDLLVCYRGHRSAVRELVFDPDGTVLYSTDGTYYLRWEISPASTARAVGTAREVFRPESRPWQTCLTPDRCHLLVVGDTCPTAGWEFDTLQPTPDTALAFDPFAVPTPPPVWREWFDRPPDWTPELTATSPDSTLLAFTRIGNGRQQPVTIATRGDRHPVILPRTATPVTALGLASINRRLATGHQDGTISLWDAQTGELVYTFVGEDHAPIAAVAFSPDCRWLWSCDDAGRIVARETGLMIPRDEVRRRLAEKLGPVLPLLDDRDPDDLTPAPGKAGGRRTW